MVEFKIFVVLSHSDTRCVLLQCYLAHLNVYYEVYNLTYICSSLNFSFYNCVYLIFFIFFIVVGFVIHWNESAMYLIFIINFSVTSVQFSSVAQSYPTLGPHGLQHARLPCPSPTPGACSNPCSLSRWCHPTISSSVIPISSYLQSFPISASFPMSRLFASGVQSIGVSASPSVLPMNIQDWCPLGWTGWISLQSKGLSRVFPNTTDQKHQFFGTQLSL